MKNSFEIIVVNSKLEFEKGEVKISYNKDDVTLHLIMKNYFHSSTNTFPFDALVDIRLKLEEENKRICCKGSRIDVFPSGQMLVGFLASYLEMGQQMTKFVNILDSEEDINLLSTVKEQEEYYDKWLDSL